MDKLGHDVRDVVVGATKINTKPLNVAAAQRVVLSLRDALMSPAKRMVGACANN